MPKPPSVPALRGAAQLATDATAGLTDLVEAMHERIARLPGIAGDGRGRTRGITGLVYQTVRGVTHLVGGSLDALLALLALLEPALDPAAPAPLPGPERAALLAALNGVLGALLAATANPLATPMGWHRDGWPLNLQAPVTGKPLLLIHGLCMNDRQWARDGHDHGAALAADAGYTPVYLRYNSGRHVSTNGAELSAAIEDLVAAWPRPIERLAIVGHSMGGLLARSAWQQAVDAGRAWPARVDDLVFLGTPHHGAPLERAGNWIDVLLGATPYAAPFARLGQVRSAGITDLRHGNLLDADWRGSDRFARGADQRRVVALPDGPRCWAIAASLAPVAGSFKERALGDGLVPLASALGRHRDPARTLAFAPERQWIAQGVGHLGLLGDAGVYAMLRRCLG